MSKLRRKIGALLYYSIAQHLPISYSGVQLGQTALRRFCGKLMLASCGKKVNIEKGAMFSAKVSLGDYSGIGINKLRKMSDSEDCPFVLWIGSKRLIKRRRLDEYVDRMYSI